MPRQLPDLANALHEPLAVVPDDYVAIHEAGHALACFLSGGFTHHVSLETQPPEALMSQWSDESRAISSLGGPAATLYKYGSIDGGQFDIGAAKLHARVAGISYPLIAGKTMKLIVDMWPALEQLVLLLRERRHLNATEFHTALMGDLDTDMREVIAGMAAPWGGPQGSSA